MSSFSSSDHVQEQQFVPEEITCEDQIFDLAFHNSTNILATGLINGNIEVWRYGQQQQEGNQLLARFANHTASCRGLAISEDGRHLYSISADRSLKAVDAEHGSVALEVNEAHSEPLNRIFQFPGSYGGNCSLLATGDDAGCVKLWDLRTNSSAAVMTYKLHEDFVSGFAFNAEAHTLLSVAGDATLCAYDVRSSGVTARSDDQEAELHCVEVMKNGRKVVCGTQEGVMITFSWGNFGDCSDRYPSHPDAVDCLYKIDENTLLTGSSDGLIRVVQLQPNKLLGVIGDHDDFPVEGIRRGFDGRILGSFSHDECVRFWDVSMFADDEGDGEEVDGNQAEEDEAAVSASVSAARGGRRGNGEDEEEDNEEEWEDEDEDNDSEMVDSDKDDDNSDEDESGNNSRAGGRRIPSATEKFYADL